MVACTFILALANVLFKFYAVRDDFWVTTFWTFAGEALFGFALLARPRYRRQIIALGAQPCGPASGRLRRQ